MSPKFNIAVDESGESVITITNQGETIQVTHEHPNFARITDALAKGEDPTPFLTVANLVAQQKGFTYEQATEQIEFEGKPVPKVVKDALVRYANEGRDTNALVKFMHRLAHNPSDHSREQLWKWIEQQGLTIDKDGYIIGFKSVTTDLKSHNTTGTASVDGKKHTGSIPNHVGAVVTMPRAEVVDDPRSSCSRGLHVGTFGYAREFKTVAKIMEVKVDPADCVSVPNDNSFTKMRVCKYQVVRIHDRGAPTPTGKKPGDLTHHEPEATFTPKDLADALKQSLPGNFITRLLRRLAGDQGDGDPGDAS